MDAPGKAVVSCAHSCIDKHKVAILSKPSEARVSIGACITECISRPTAAPEVNKLCIGKCAAVQVACHKAAGETYKTTVKECKESKANCVSVC